MIYITGDTHGDFKRIKEFCRLADTTAEDVIVILGDAGINYYGNESDGRLKYILSKLPVTLFCIHGNHEMRPQKLPDYEQIIWNGGIVYKESKYPNLLFAADGEIYDLDGLKCLVIGGAYSVDKGYRLMKGYGWWDDEQPSEEIKRKTEAVLKDNPINIVLSHTCPLKYQPAEAFLSCVNQKTVDTSTEEWLDHIEEITDYKKWYCGHYHIRKRTDKLQFMFDDIEELKIR